MSRLALPALALLAAYFAKAWYADADAEALDLFLAPTARLAGWLTGATFEREPGAGYLSREHVFLIAPACAGVNYALVAFTALALGFAPARRGWVRAGAWLLGAAALAYGAALVVNALRIALALALEGAAPRVGLEPGHAHRLLGVVIYLGSLWALCFGVAHLFHRPPAAWRNAWLPLGLYLAMTLGVPLLRGAGGGAFWEHAAAVAGAALALALPLGAGLAFAARRRAAAPAAHSLHQSRRRFRCGRGPVAGDAGCGGSRAAHAASPGVPSSPLLRDLRRNGC